jgi:hypothetical protein
MTTAVDSRTKTIGTEVNSTIPFGDLLITLTSAYDWRYNDSGSGSDRDGSFFHPQSQGSMRPLGSVVIDGYDDINNNRASMLVGDGGNAAVASPVSYTSIWNDAGSGGDNDGSVWRPVAPQGYVTLGDVAVKGYDAPSLEDVWCVRADLVTPSAYDSAPTWTDQGSGGDNDIAAWHVVVRDPANDATKGVLEPDTFISVASYDEGPNYGLAYVLLVPIVAQSAQVPAGPPPLTSRTAPPAETQPYMDRAVTLPFTSMFARTDRQSLDNIGEPFCTLQRWCGWTLTLFDDNTTSLPQSSSKATTVGITDTTSETFANSVGVKVGVSYGVLTKASIELSYQFTYTTSSTRALLTSDTVTRQLATPSQHAAALWTAHFAFKSVRLDGSEIGNDLDFDVDVFSHDQYPAATDAQSVARAC